MPTKPNGRSCGELFLRVLYKTSPGYKAQSKLHKQNFNSSVSKIILPTHT